MSYTRVNWQDAPSVSTPLSASNLNKMDAGIKQNADDIEALQQHTYDSALDDTSTNAPQTKVVKKAIEDAVESVTISTDPTLSNEGQAADAKATGEAVAQVKSAIDALKITDTASGAIASFPDGAAMPMESLTVEMEPIQDLHGQDAPYPAGGGKNKILLSAETIRKPSWYTGGWYDATLNAYNGITQVRGYIEGSAGGIVINGLPSGTYTFSMTFTGETLTCKIYIGSTSDGTTLDTVAANLTMTKNGTRYSYTFDIPSGSISIVIRPTIHTSDTPYDLNDLQLELGSEATAYAPYENLCPITGRDSVTVTRTGVNLLDQSHITEASGWVRSTAEGYTELNGVPVYTGENRALYNAFGGGNLYPIPDGCFKENVQYVATFWWCSTGSTNNGVKVGFRYTDGTTSQHGASPGTTSWKRQALMSDANKTVAGIFFSYNSNYAIYMSGLAVMEASESDANTVFLSNMESATIQLGQTVYGGTVDVTGGKAHVTHALVEFDGSDDEYWALYNAFSGFYTNDVAKLMKIGTRQSGLSNWTKQNTGLLTPDGFWLGVGNAFIYVIGVQYHLDTPDVSAWRTYLAEHPLQIYYPLAEPFDIDITPASLSTLKGQNNVWSDADSVSVEYVADPKLYISRLTEPDADMVADANIVNGQYFMVGNSLYLAATNIASGATIVPGVNCTRTNLAAALNAINA